MDQNDREFAQDEEKLDTYPLRSMKIKQAKPNANDEENEEGTFYVASDRDVSNNDNNDSTSVCSKDRDTWSNQFDFVLSLLGYAVGLGNLWRFPYLAMKNGGGAFLVPFVICLIVCGFPLFFLEVSLGQFLGKSSIHVWLVFPLLKGIGFGMFVMNVVISLYYTMIMAWTLYYLANSFRSTLPWSTCDNSWNTDNCIVKDLKHYMSSWNTSDVTVINNTAPMTFMSTTTSNVTAPVNGKSDLSNISQMSAEEEYWQYNVLNMSPGIETYGTIQWHLVVALGVTWIILFLCVIRGVKSIGKVVYVTALLPYVLLTVFLIRGLMLDGSVDGIIFYLKPDPVKLMEPRVWIEAALQVFYSLGPGWGPLIAMASHNKFKNNCLRDSMVVCFVGEGTSIFSGLVVFTVLGFIAHELSLPIEEVVKSGPGLGFVVYPQALSRLPIPQLWSVLFFLMLLTVGMDSMFANVECLLTGITDIFPQLRRQKRQIAVLSVICLLGFILDLPICYQGGLYLFQLYDWYIAILSIPVLTFLECLAIAWWYGMERYSSDVELMIGRGIPVFVRICLCFVSPFIIGSCFVFTLMVYEPPVYGSYHYPSEWIMFGWIITVLPLLPLVTTILHYFISQRARSYIKVLSEGVQPNDKWRPHSNEYNELYKYHRYSYAEMTFIQRIKVNVFGK